MSSKIVSHACRLAGLAVVVGAVSSASAVDVTVDSSATWLGFMNVSNLPAPFGDGAFQFPSPWGVADLSASFAGSGSGTVLTLTPNTIGDPNPYWYIGGGGPGALGNKIMEANLYVEDSVTSLSGQTVNFSGTVLSNTLNHPVGPGYTAIAFIRDFAPDFSSVVEVTAPLTAGNFNLSLATINDPARHVQYGFQVAGRNVWATDVASFGSVVVTPIIPEPATLGLIALAPLVLRRRRA
jgi:hypothetical protein